MIFFMNHLGEISGALSFYAYLMYIISTFRGKTKPSRSTWWILTFVGILIMASSYSLNAKENLWIQLSYVIGPLIIAIQSTNKKYGYGSSLLTIDKICLSGSICCLAGWVIFNSPLVALIGSIIVDFIGLIPTIKKSYTDPQEEDPSAWAVEFFAGILNALNITVWFTTESKDWIYALYLLTINGVMFFLLWRPQKKSFSKNLQIKQKRKK